MKNIVCNFIIAVYTLKQIKVIDLGLTNER